MRAVPPRVRSAEHRGRVAGRGFDITDKNVAVHQPADPDVGAIGR